MSMLSPLKKTIALPGKNMREKVDPFNIFLPKDPEDPLAPIESKAKQSTVEAAPLNANQRRRQGYLFPSGTRQGVGP